MVKYKTELHCHSRDVSTCSNESAEGIVEKYLRYGYSTILLTNHLSKNCHSTPQFEGKSWKEKCDHFVNGYHVLKKAAEGTPLNILFGAEIRFPENSNDYILIGLTEEYLYSHEDLYCVSVGKFHEQCYKDGMLLIQAHPMRRGMYINYQWDVDGWEVYNGHPTQVSSNSAAFEFARQYPEKHMTSGSDHHDTDHMPTGGILTDFEIKSVQQIYDTLKSGNYSLIMEEDIRLGKKRL